MVIRMSIFAYNMYGMCVVINGGLIAEVGTHASLLQIEGGLYSKLVSRQVI